MRRMLEQNLRLIAARGDQVEHAVGQARFLPKFGNAHGGLRRKAGGLQHHAVSAGDADGSHPSLRNHGREIPRRDAGEDAQRFAELHRVITGGDIHQRLALHHLGRAAGELDNLDDLEDVAHGLVPLLAVLLGAQIGQFVQMLVEQLLHLEEHLSALADRRVAPCREMLWPRPGWPLRPPSAVHCGA